VNENGVMVGFSENNQDPMNIIRRAFVGIGTNLVYLDSILLGGGAGWVMIEARAINNSGQIVGWGAISNQIRGFLLTPTVKSIEMDINVGEDPSTNNLEVSWEVYGSNTLFTLETQNVMSNGTWTPVPPANQWPSGLPYWNGRSDVLTAPRQLRVRGTVY